MSQFEYVSTSVAEHVRSVLAKLGTEQEPLILHAKASRLGLSTRESLDVAIVALDALCGKVEQFSPEWEKLGGAVQTFLAIRDQCGCREGLGPTWDDTLCEVIDTVVYG